MGTDTLNAFFARQHMLNFTNSMIISYKLGRPIIVATTRKTITITDKQDMWIKNQIAAGEFTNDSEYIRDLIRRDQARKSEIAAIRAALIEGEESGFSGRTPEEVKQQVRERLQKNGQLSID